MRSLQQDSFRPSLVILGIALVLLAGWGAWFLGSQMALTENGRNARLERDGSLSVWFTPEATARLRPGQKAWIALAASAETPAQTLPAVVMNIPDTSNDPAALFVQSSIDFKAEQIQSVQVEVEYVSPLLLVLRSAGLYVEGPKLAVR